MSEFIDKNNLEKYIGRLVWACFPDTKTKSHARLLGYVIRASQYKLKCGIHNNVFYAPEIKEIEGQDYK